MTPAWPPIVTFYEDLVARPGWDFMRPMLSLCQRVMDEPISQRLYPHTSHEWLCLAIHSGYQPDLPFFSCGVRDDGTFLFELWHRVGTLADATTCATADAHETFLRFANRLHALAAPQ